MKKSVFIYFLPVLLMALLVVALFHTLMHNSKGKFAQHVGDPVPATMLPTLEASAITFNTADWKSRAYAVNFFASWCIDCRAEHDGLLELKDAGVPLIGIAYKDNPAPLRELLENKGDPYLAVAMDNTGKAFIDWGLTGVPETLIVDKTGIIRFHYIGPMTENVIVDDFLPAWKDAQK